jgi:hypothetical protein
VLCSVLNPRRAAAELVRVLRPGGELRFYEHVRADSQPLAAFQWLGAPLQALTSGGCHPDRDSVARLREAGFVIEQERRFRFRPFALGALGAPHVIGLARKAAVPVPNLAGW